MINLNTKLVSLSTLILSSLKASGVEYAACVSGGGIMYLLDALAKERRIKSRFFHHEQAAGFAAEGYYKASGVPAICMVTIGPGVANAVSAAFSAYVNSVPIIFISGAKRSTIVTDYSKNRFSFPQDVDTRSLVSPVVKKFWEVNEDDDFIKKIDEIYLASIEGRPGPVWISVPLDVQAISVNLKYLNNNKKCPLHFNKVATEEIKKFLNQNKKTVILTGAGADGISGNSNYRTFLKKIGLPCITSIGSNHTIAASGKMNCGFFGPTGRRAANHILINADSLLVLGSGLDIDTTGFDRESFFANKSILLVNPDPNLNISETCSIQILRNSLSEINFSEITFSVNHQDEWKKFSLSINELLSIHAEIGTYSQVATKGYVDPYYFSNKLNSLIHPKTALVCGISLDLISISQCLNRVEASIRLFATKHCGQLGWELPASVGVADSGVYKKVVCVTGDGSAMFNIQELATLTHQKTPIKLFIYDNQGYNSIRTSQKAHLGGRIVGADTSDLTFPDWRSLGKAFGFKYSVFSRDKQLSDKSIQGILNSSENELCILKVDPDKNRTPRLVSIINDGRFQSPALDEQFPPLPSSIVNQIKALKIKYGI